jgi:hypothetical protein
MADSVKKIITLEVDVNSGEIKQLNSELKKTEKQVSKTSKESSGFADKLLSVGDAIKGMGIGIAIAGLAKFGQALQSNQRIADATESAMNSLDVAFSRFTNSIAEVTEDTSWRDWLSTLASIDPTNTLKLVDTLVNGTEAGREYTDELEKIGKQITANNKELALLEVEQRKLQLLNQKDAEIQRQLRDDYNLSFEERFAANDKLAKILDESIKKEQEVTLTRIANLEYLQENLTYSFEREIEIKNLRVELLDIEERITGVKSEQQAAERSLIAEQKAAAEELKKQREEDLKQREEEWQAFADWNEEQWEREAELEIKKRAERRAREKAALEEQKKALLENEREYYDELEAVQEAYTLSQMSAMDIEIRLVQDQYYKLIEEAEKYGEDKAALEEQQQAQINEIKSRYASQEKQLDQDVQSAKLQLAADSFGALIELNNAFAGETEEAQRKAFQFDKALRIGQTIMSSIQGVQNAFTTASASPITAAFPAYPFIQAGLAGTFGAAQVLAISRSKFDSSGGGGSPSAISAPTTQPQAPQFNTVGTSGFNQLSESIASQNKQPVQAYVVANDVSSAQSLERNKVEQASFP